MNMVMDIATEVIVMDFGKKLFDGDPIKAAKDSSVIEAYLGVSDQMISMNEIFNEITANGGATPSRKVREIAERFPEKIAFRNKEFGIWHEVTYEDFWNQTQFIGHALKYYGVDVKDKVAIHSENLSLIHI